MSDSKERFVTLLQGAMLILNVLCVAFICVLIYVTTGKILANYDAREFLNSISSGKPQGNSHYLHGLYGSSHTDLSGTAPLEGDTEQMECGDTDSGYVCMQCCDFSVEF